MKNTKCIIITGTHHTPAIELINLLRSDVKTSWKISYIGHRYPSETHIIHTIIPKLKVTFYNLDCGKFDRKNLDKTLLSIPKIISSFFKSLSLLNKIKPDIVVSFGGYVSVPVIMAAYFKKIPSITHEQTLTTSLSTKINSFFVNKIALSFDNSSPNKKTVVTGNLIRQDIFKTGSAKYDRLINLPLIYITGGNQGSVFLNQLIIKLIPKLNRKFSIIHQTGKDFPVHHFPNYFPTSYIDTEDIGWVLNHARIVISRAGANTCQELDVLDKKSIIIPHPFTQQNEQLLNADWLQHRHPDTVIVIPQPQANPTIVLHAVNQLLILPDTKKVTHQQPNFKLLHLIHELI